MTRAGREVVWLSLVTAGAVTLLDGLLLELQRGFFSGGFLAQDSATTSSDRLVFLFGSLSLDGIWASLGVLLAVLIAGSIGWGSLARRALAVIAGAGPLLIASFVEYQVLARLGDAFDLHLMFDLVGRRPVELLAVSWVQLILPIAVLALAGGATLWLLRSLNRRSPHGLVTLRVGRSLRYWLVSALVLTTFSTALRLHSDVQDNGMRRKPAGQAVGAIVTSVSDLDRDGFGLLSRPADPAPLDARIYPFAIDIPGNGIDEDGIGGDLPVDASAPIFVESPRFAHTPPTIVVMLETFRADLLGAREDGREITPVLNRLRDEGGASTRAYSHNGYTVQSRFHLFTGGLARGAENTLLDDFKRNGYETAYFSGQDESFGGAAFDVGGRRADHFYDARQDRDRRYTTFTTPGSLGVSARVVVERLNTYLAARRPDRPLFLYVNFYDTHFPYAHDELETLVSDVRVPQRDILQARAERVRLMYRNTAANVDKAVGAVRDAVRAHTGREPAVIVLADHGESLFDGGFLGHGYVLDDVQTRIPLVAAGLALDMCEPVGQVDLRGAIAAALARPEAGGVPTFRVCPEQKVFQYLGLLSRPRQIAHVSQTRRLTYDLREHRVQVGDGDWGDVDELDDGLRAEWLVLVRHWERLRAIDSPGRNDPS